VTIYVGSRYEDGQSGFVTDSEGDVNLVVFRAEDEPTPKAQNIYVTVAGDRLDFLAYKIYNRTDLWWYIADANPDLLLTDPIAPGTQLRIPGAPNRV
jgi:phage tail protein X